MVSLKAGAFEQFNDAGWLRVNSLAVFVFGDADHRRIATEKDVASVWIKRPFQRFGEFARRDEFLRSSLPTSTIVTGVKDSTTISIHSREGCVATSNTG